jgi:malonyl-CoA/methylmalonyl-CoA synthetase
LSWLTAKPQVAHSQLRPCRNPIPSEAPRALFSRDSPYSAAQHPLWHHGPVLLRTLLDLSLVGRAQDVGLEHHGRAHSFAELRLRADAMARELSSRGIRTGDRLALYLANRTEWIDLYVGCVSLGCVVVPINILYREREVAHILEDAEPSAVVADGAIPGAGTTPVWDVSELSACSERCVEPLHTWPALAGDSPALIVYTSGTTGRPKGVVLTHHNLASNAANLIACWNITSQDRLLLALPLFHVHGLGNGLHCWLASGCRLRLETRFDHTAAAEWFLDFRPTVFFGVPTMYSRMLEWPGAVAREIGRHARLFVSGSAPLPPALLEGFEERFGHRILERYGMTETLMTLGNPLAGERRAGTVGVPFPGVSARVVDAGGRDVRTGEIGELQVKGSTVFAGYWRRDEATRAAFQDGWFRTGDLAERAGDGYVTLRGRASDLIVSGGFNIYPREIEEFLLEQPEIREAAVIGVADERRGEVPVAFVVVRHGVSISDEELRLRCRTSLASFKVPRRFSIVGSLPRNALGKVQKHLLRM